MAVGAAVRVVDNPKNAPTYIYTKNCSSPEAIIVTQRVRERA